MHDISRFSISRNFSDDPQRREEVLGVYPFFIRVQDSLEVQDVEYGPNPPDFLIRTSKCLIGVETTELDPMVFSSGGYRKRAEFCSWEKETKQKPLPKHLFDWGTYKARDSLLSFKGQVTRKAKRVLQLQGRFDEHWLLVHLADGSPAGGVVETNFTLDQRHKESFLDYAGKYLHEMKQICEFPHPFTYIMLTCGARFLSFPAGPNPYGFPVPCPTLLERGAKASDELLDWTTRISSVRRHWTPAQGDFDTWVNMPPLETFKDEGK